MVLLIPHTVMFAAVSLVPIGQMTGTLEKAPVLPQAMPQGISRLSPLNLQTTLLIYSKSALWHSQPGHPSFLCHDYNHRPALSNSMSSSTSWQPAHTHACTSDYLDWRAGVSWPSWHKILKVSDNFCLFTMFNSTQPSTKKIVYIRWIK